MIKSIKASLILCLSLMLVLFSCKKEEEEKPVITTYKLTYKATIPASGSTTFSTINYKKADGTTATLTNTTTSFLESFTISSGFNIFLEVTGTNNATTITPPSLPISYTVEKFENDVYKGVVCADFGVVILGSPGAWTFNASSNTTFNGVSCQ
jgi:hypothetical protein